MTFFEYIKCVLIVDPHLSMTQAGEGRTDKTQEGPLVNRWVLTVVELPLPPPPPALQAGLSCEGFQTLAVTRAPRSPLWAEESRVLPSQKSTFAPVGACLWTDKDSPVQLWVGILQGGEAIFCHMLYLLGRHSDTAWDPNSPALEGHGAEGWRPGSQRARLGCGD